MELIFNELSENPLCSDKTEVFERVDRFISAYKEANKEFGFNKIRFHKGYEGFDLLDDYTLNDYCNETQHSRTKGLLLRGLFKMPFIDDDSEEEKRYIESSFALQKEEKQINPYGLAVAFLYSAPAIGFLSEKFWDNYVFDLTVTATGIKQEKVYCISKLEHIKEQLLIDFIKLKQPVELLETNIEPEKKTLRLRDDHGKNKLEEFSKKILNSKYVEAVINSLPYNPHSKNFIKKIYPDGKIEVILPKTDNGLGIIIKTTGRNLKETRAIAKKLEEDFV
jgi:hypothetical protein